MLNILVSVALMSQFYYTYADYDKETAYEHFDESSDDASHTSRASRGSDLLSGASKKSGLNDVSYNPKEDAWNVKL